MRQVQYVARGKPSRSYAKWLVLKFTWDSIGKLIASDSGEAKFRYSCEHPYDNDMLKPLQRVIDSIFKASLSYFRARRGKGEEAKDISNFFKQARLDKEFREFWRSSNNRYQEKTETLVLRFEKAVSTFEMGQ